MLALVVGPLQLPVDERPLRLGAALQEHGAVLHAVHAAVLHAASQSVHVICSPATRKREEKLVSRCDTIARVRVYVCGVRTMMLEVRALRQRISVPDVLTPGSPEKKQDHSFKSAVMSQLSAVPILTTRGQR